MSVDAEITKINEGIAQVHLALYKFNNQLDGILQGLNDNLNDFDAGVNNAVGAVNGVSHDVINIFTYVGHFTWILIDILFYFIIFY
ncbi:unnamed protein product [Cylicostephanus goldi]|uniref:Uncharacterized protein n=1 Tax=Cylicostephanus goldi TaxID=71465 RepID=A0A3P7MJW7_CYLGO|nr:unnamed protein product [Cylicostephanus goldi]